MYNIAGHHTDSSVANETAWSPFFFLRATTICHLLSQKPCVTVGSSLAFFIVNQKLAL